MYSFRLCIFATRNTFPLYCQLTNVKSAEVFPSCRKVNSAESAKRLVTRP